MKRLMLTIEGKNKSQQTVSIRSSFGGSIFAKGVKLLCCIVGVLLLASCEKESAVERVTFTDVQPDKSLTTFGISTSDFYANNIAAAVSKSWVNDTLFTFALSRTPLDLNKDGEDDFVFEIQQVLADPAEYIYNSSFTIRLNALSSNMISMENGNSGYIKSYDVNQNVDTDTFSPGIRFSETAQGGLLMSKGGDENFQLLGDYYVGVKLQVNSKPYFGWIHVKVDFFKLTLCDYAISNEPNTLIKTGQTF